MKRLWITAALVTAGCASPPPPRQNVQQPIVPAPRVQAPVVQQPRVTAAEKLEKDMMSDLRDKSRAIITTFAESNEAFLKTGNEKQLIANASNAARDNLKDPQSAQFRNVRIKRVPAGRIVCGEINAKNSYGGYVGFTLFVASANVATMAQSEDSRYPGLAQAANTGIIENC